MPETKPVSVRLSKFRFKNVKTDWTYYTHPGIGPHTSICLRDGALQFIYLNMIINYEI